jgi:2-succinyl-5-enolpyruvyl-6-hydroxy-3-cyclohexene-1-carboxylate synthase
VSSIADASFACASALVDALVAGGVRHACVSPGSRSTPLALALARDERVTVHVHLDERSAAYFALGLAKVTDEPVAIACTSGTATANYLPAIVEASQSRMPLIALTADRPPRLRGTGANQTIDQHDLYGGYVRASIEPPVPATLDDVGAWADAGRRAVSAALDAPMGPAHVNCAFEEPLVPHGEAIVTPSAIVVASSRSNDDDPLDQVRAFVAAYAGARGVVTIGSVRPPATLALLTLGALLGWPVIAEPMSGLRLEADEAGRALAAGQFLIGDGPWLDRHRPEIVLQVGATPTTRATQSLVREAECLVVLDRDHLDPDRDGRAEQRIALDPERFAATAWDHRDELGANDPSWLESWRTADLIARRAVDRALEASDELSEGRTARDVAGFLPHGATMVIGNSTPVRDLDLFMAPRRPSRIWTAPDLLRIVANRGASGIDGMVSTTLGAAATGRPTVALLGDLTFLYDAGALLWSSRLGVDATFVVLANGGGQIFALLDQAQLPEFNALFATPHPASIGAVSSAAGAKHRIVHRAPDLAPALEGAMREGGVQVIEVPIDAAQDRQRREDLRAAVSQALRER